MSNIISIDPPAGESTIIIEVRSPDPDRWLEQTVDAALSRARMAAAADCAALVAATCPRCATDRRDCTCPGGLRSRSLAEAASGPTRKSDLATRILESEALIAGLIGCPPSWVEAQPPVGAFVQWLVTYTGNGLLVQARVTVTDREMMLAGESAAVAGQLVAAKCRAVRRGLVDAGVPMLGGETAG